MAILSLCSLVGLDQIGGQAAALVLAIARGAQICVVFYDHSAARHDGVDLALNLEAFPRGVVHVHVVIVHADGPAGVGVIQHNVRVASRSDHALLGIQPKHAGGRRCAQLHPARQCDLALQYTLVDQVHAVFDATNAIRYGAEIAKAEFLLVLHAERAMVGTDHAEIIGAKSAPQVGVMVLVFGAQWRAAHIGSAAEAGGSQMVFEVQIEVLRARLGEHVGAFASSDGYLLECLACRQVHDVQRGCADLGQLDCAVGSFAFQLGPPNAPVVDRVGFASLDRLLCEQIDRDAVLGVHHDHGAIARGLLHGPKNLGVVAQEDPRVRHEQLEAGDAFVDQDVHLFERTVIDASENHVEGVVDRAVAFGFGHPLVETCPHVLAGLLYGEVDDRCGATPGGGPGPGLEGVASVGSPKREFHVGVAIHAAGDDVLAGGIDDAFGATFGGVSGGGTGRHKRNDGLAIDKNVGGVSPGGGDDGAAFDHDGHGIYKVRSAVEVVVAKRLNAYSVDGPNEVHVGARRSWLLDVPQIGREPPAGRRRIEHDLGTGQPELAPAFGEVPVIADVHADLAHGGVKHRVAQIAGPEVELLPETVHLRNVGLSVFAEVAAVGIDDCGGVVEDTRLFLFVHRQHEHHAQLGSQGLETFCGRPIGNRLGVAVELRVLDLAEVRPIKQLLETHDLCALGGRLAHVLLMQVNHGVFVASPGRLNDRCSHRGHGVTPGLLLLLRLARGARVGQTSMCHKVSCAMGCFSMASEQVAEHHDVVAAALVRGDTVLLCHRHPNRRWYPNVWDVPGGHVDPGESPLDALVRELREELGIEIDPTLAVSVLRSSPKPDLDIEIWAVPSWQGEIVNAEPDEHDELRWLVPRFCADMAARAALLSLSRPMNTLLHRAIALFCLCSLLAVSCRVSTDDLALSSVDGASASSLPSTENSTALPILGPVPGSSHWHAAYVVRVCDDVLAPFDSDADPLGIHSHADGVMHVHPFFEQSGFEKATLGLFADAMGMTLAEGELTLPGGGVWRDGDMCGDQPGRVYVDKWHDPIPESAVERIFADPQNIRFLADGELYQIAFAPVDAPPVVPPSTTFLSELSNLALNTAEPWVDPDPSTTFADVQLWAVSDVTERPCVGEQVPERVRSGTPACYTRDGAALSAAEAITAARAVVFNRQPAVELRITPTMQRLLQDHFVVTDQPITIAVEIDGAVITAPTLARLNASEDRLVLAGGLTEQTARELAQILNP
ncbi:CTP pyrophosphohydrolase [Nymphon striatum]|nr:CTP pyrophosphohydrolase [Nymphon striatum]